MTATQIDRSTEGDLQMQHPFHIHGAGRFLGLDPAGVPEPNLVWKDTVLVGPLRSSTPGSMSAAPAAGWLTATSPNTLRAA